MSDNLIIRAMTEADLPAVHKIETAVFARPWSLDSFRRELVENCKVARYLVAERLGEVVGYVGIWLIMEEAHITNVAVAPNHQGNGYGDALVRSILEMAKSLGIVYMTLECRRSNNRAQNLYKKYGFEQVGFRKKYYEDNDEDAALFVNTDIQNTN